MGMVPDKNAANNFFGQLMSQANQVVGSQFNTPLITVEMSKQGDFPFYFTDPASFNFNLGTFNFISQCVVPGQNIQNAVQLVPSFPNQYDQIITGVTFTLSDADNQALNKANLNASAQGMSVVQTYEQTFGTITPDQISTANTQIGGITTKLDYVTRFVIGYQWSGQQFKQQPPLSFVQMQQARSLQNLLVNMPAAGQIVLNPFTTYLSILGPTARLSDVLQLGNWTINQLKLNTENPSTTNGGITTTDGNVNVGYSLPNQTVSKILNDLQNTGRAINLSMTASQSNSSTWSVSIGTQAGFVLAGDFIDVGVSNSSSYNMLSFASSNTSVSVNLSYAGYSMVNVGATDWNQANNTGWFDASPIAQAAKNGPAATATSVTGFKWASNTTPSVNFAKNGNFGVLQGLLISNYPTVTITYSSGNYSSVKQAFSSQTNVDVYLFGLFKVGSVSSSLYAASVSEQRQDGSFTITLAPSPQTLNVPPLQQTAYVIGASVNYPVASSSQTVLSAMSELAGAGTIAATREPE